MAIIATDDVEKLKTLFHDNLKDPVTIQLFSQKQSQLVVPGRTECEYCEETEQLLAEVAETSDKIELKVHDVRADPAAAEAFGMAPDQIPAFVLQGDNRGKVRYFGIPAGYEFASLVQDIVDVSRGSTSLSASAREQLAQLPSDVHIRVFVTPT